MQINDTIQFPFALRKKKYIYIHIWGIFSMSEQIKEMLVNETHLNNVAS